MDWDESTELLRRIAIYIDSQPLNWALKRERHSLPVPDNIKPYETIVRQVFRFLTRFGIPKDAIYGRDYLLGYICPASSFRSVSNEQLKVSKMFLLRKPRLRLCKKCCWKDDNSKILNCHKIKKKLCHESLECRNHRIIRDGVQAYPEKTER